MNEYEQPRAAGTDEPGVRSMRLRIGGNLFEDKSESEIRFIQYINALDGSTFSGEWSGNASGVIMYNVAGSDEVFVPWHLVRSITLDYNGDQQTVPFRKRLYERTK